MIVIPAVDVREGKVVRLRHGRPQEMTVYGDAPEEAARRFAEEGAAWVHVVDLDAALGSGDNRGVIGRVVERAGVPVQVGGGLRTMFAVENVFSAGAARVVLGTEAVADPAFLAECVRRHGDGVVVALDTEAGVVRVRGWTAPAGAWEEVLPRLVDAGAPRFLITAIARDGTLAGPDLDLYRRVAERTDVPVLASGGVGTLEHLRGLAAVGVEGVVVGKALYERAFTLREALEAAA